MAFTSESLKDKQAAEREFERKKFILSAALGTDNINAMINASDTGRADVVNLYNSRVKDFVVDFNGEIIEGLAAKDVVVAKEYKLPDSTRKLPVFTVAKEGSEEVEFYVLPIYGYGLWDNVFGYASLQGNLNVVQGVIFDHVGETPGLGARITEGEVQKRYQGKQIYDAAGTLMSVNMQKGEGADYSSEPHKVNGLTGATITGVGVNNMMFDYLSLYENFFNKTKAN